MAIKPLKINWSMCVHNLMKNNNKSKLYMDTLVTVEEKLGQLVEKT